MSDNILSINNVTKEFIGVRALNDVSFNIRRGEIHAILGENGAGKSTLMNILSGVFLPTSGEIIYDDAPVYFQSPKDAKDRGIEMIHQELSLAQSLPVWENIFQGRLITNRAGLIDKKTMIQESLKLLGSLNVTNIDPEVVLGTLNLGQMQLVEIAKAISSNPKLLIMDEPTSALSSKEVEVVFNIMRTFKKNGATILFITHKLEEVMEIADSITVLRDGELIANCIPSETSIPDLISLMVGRKVQETLSRRKSDVEDRETVLEVKDISVPGYVKNASFCLHRGEVLGLTGLVGAGRSELLRAIFGMEKIQSGEIYLEGKKVRFNHPAEAIAAGIGLVSEDRKRLGLFLKMSVSDNITVVHAKQLSGKLFLKKRKIKAEVKKYMAKLSIKTLDENKKIEELSGGNQQKAIIARWLMHNPKILMLDEPTHGVDVGAKEEIYSIIDELANQGISVILLSSELPEVLRMSDRIMVMHHGELKGILNYKEASQIKIMNLIFGISQSESVSANGI